MDEKGKLVVEKEFIERWTVKKVKLIERGGEKKWKRKSEGGREKKALSRL